MGGEDGVVVKQPRKQPANLENGRAEEEEVDGEHVIGWCSRRTGVKPDKGNKDERGLKEENDTVSQETRDRRLLCQSRVSGR